MIIPINKFNPNKKGFTLVELIVVLAIFLFIVGAAIGIFISIVEHQRRVLAEQEFLSQISYAQEYMSKALRMAVADPSGNCTGSANYIYLLGPYDISGGYAGIYRGIKFLNQSDLDSSNNPICEQFFLDTDGILKELKNSTNLSDAVPLTSPTLKITSVRFSVDGLDGSVNGQGCNGTPNQCGVSSADSAPRVQPKVTIFLNVNIPGDGQRIIQTTVSARNLNVQL